MQGLLLAGAAAAGLLAAAASLAERRRVRRRETHGIGFMPWPTLVVTALFAALVMLALGLGQRQ